MSGAIRANALRMSFPRLLAIAALLALIAGGWAVDAWLLVALGLWAAGALAVRRAFRRLRLHLRLEGGHVFAHEWIRVRATLANPGWWPLPWLEVASDQPAELAGGCRRVEWLPGGAVRARTWTWYAHRRGLYRLGAARLHGGDWFGLQRMEELVDAALEVVVYPRVLPLPSGIDLPVLPEGPHRDPVSPFEDDLPAGVRPYRPGDPERRIAWRASARRGDLMVREHPPVRERARGVFLDLRREDWSGPAEDRLLEGAVSLAASLAWDRRSAARPVGLGTWAASRLRDVHMRSVDTPPALLWLPPRAGETARARMLRTLALVEPGAGPPFAQVLRALLPAVPWGCQSVWVVPHDADELRETAALWHARGRPVLMLCVDRRTGPAAARLGGLTLRAWEVRVHGNAFSFA